MLSYMMCKNKTDLSDCKGVFSQIAYFNELRFHITDEGLSTDEPQRLSRNDKSQ